MHRVHLLAVAACIGAAIFALAVCGALSLGPATIEVLPWGLYEDVPVPLNMLIWWNCGPLAYTITAGLDSNCTMSFLTGSRMDGIVDPAGPVYAGLVHLCNTTSESAWNATDVGSELTPVKNTSASPWNATALSKWNATALWAWNATAQPKSTTATDLYGQPSAQGNCVSSWLAHTFALEKKSMVRVVSQTSGLHADWKLNHWGLCVFPRDSLYQGASWYHAAAMAGGAAHTFNLGDDVPHEGLCRPWTDFNRKWADHALMVCASPAVDTFTLVMTAFGGFLNIPNAITRMFRNVDRHVKTINLILLATASTIPPVVALAQFSNGCVAAISGAFEDDFKERAVLGMGAVTFMVSIALLVPYALIHLSIPAVIVSSATEMEESRVRKRTSVEAQLHRESVEQSERRWSQESHRKTSRTRSGTRSRTRPPRAADALAPTRSATAAAAAAETPACSAQEYADHL